MRSLEVIPGLRYLPGYLSGDQQALLIAAIDDAIAAAPLFIPVMPRTGARFSVQMTNIGPLGWVSDRAGYRYQPNHPVTDQPWPVMPEQITGIWQRVADYQGLPEACLVNYYKSGTRMGLHRDADEDDLSAPVVSISLGDTAVLRIGGIERKARTQSLKLHSGDVMVMGGPARLVYHGIDRIVPGTSSLLEDSLLKDSFLKGGGRINLTLRRVTVCDH